MTDYETKKRNAAIIRAMLKDDEYMAGGVFSKEAYYMKRYGITQEEMQDMQTHVWRAVVAGIEAYRHEWAS